LFLSDFLAAVRTGVEAAFILFSSTTVVCDDTSGTAFAKDFGVVTVVICHKVAGDQFAKWVATHFKSHKGYDIGNFN